MAKNTQNELKFGSDMYFYAFYQILEIFWKFLKLADFWPKNHHLARFSRRDFETFFSTEIVSGPSKMLRSGWKSVYLLPIMCLTNVTYFCWIILSFDNFICVQSCGVGHFWSFLAQFNENRPSRQLWTHIKSPKLKIIQQK